MKFGFCINQQT